MADVIGQIAAGRGASPTGIYSPQANASGGLTTLAAAEAKDALWLAGAQTGTFAGQAVDATTVLVKYTCDDYGTIDFSILVPGSHGYYNGDFNFDGVINGDDYGVIDFTIIAQGAAL
jgi:hypothetical protein